MTMTGKRIVWIGLAAVVVTLLVVAFRPRPVHVDAAPVTRGPLRVTADEEGRTQVKRRYLVSAPLQGKLLRIELKAGDRVEEGALLARLVPADAPLLDPRVRSEQEARLHAFEAAVSQAAVNIQRARVLSANARADLDRKRQLAAKTAIPAHDLEIAENEAAVRTQDLASAEFGEKVAGHQLAEARAALQRGRTGRTDEFEIRAPASGLVLRVARESEGVVTAGAGLMEVGDPEALEIVADFLTVEAVRVRPGMAASVDHWGGAKTLSARVRTVEPSGFTKLSALGVEEQRVRVLLDFTSPLAEREALGDAFRVEVHVVTWEAGAVLRVPTAALFRRNDSWMAFAVEDGRVRSRRVEIGEQSPDAAELRNGAREGELVVLRPGESLRDGLLAEASVSP
jgi:HlyD family secretion protein